MTLFLTLAALGGILGWLVATWWFADDEPVLAPPGKSRVTFKQVVQSALLDIAEIVAPVTNRTSCIARRLWAFFGPRITNRALIATVFADMTIVAAGQDVWAFMADHPVLLLGVVAMNLLTPLTPAGAPARIPPPPSPTGGYVNNEALQ